MCIMSKIILTVLVGAPEGIRVLSKTVHNLLPVVVHIIELCTLPRQLLSVEEGSLLY